MWGNLMPNLLTIDICVSEYNFQPYGFIFVIAPITSKRTFDSTSNMHYIVCWGWQQWCTKHQKISLKHWLFFAFNYQPCFAQLPPCAKVGEHQGWWLHRRTIWYQLQFPRLFPRLTKHNILNPNFNMQLWPSFMTSQHV